MYVDIFLSVLVPHLGKDERHQHTCAANSDGLLRTKIVRLFPPRHISKKQSQLLEPGLLLTLPGLRALGVPVGGRGKQKRQARNHRKAARTIARTKPCAVLRRRPVRTSL